MSGGDEKAPGGKSKDIDNKCIVPGKKRGPLIRRDTSRSKGVRGAETNAAEFKRRIQNCCLWGGFFLRK